ncbi:NUDIX hydrolase [Candidatus Shapirobacteria bacterium]|nr:NUDIX hydrolase [Candidatus Shapirobacteria bacterium]
MKRQEAKIKTCDNKSVGMLIKRGESLLLIERRKPPFGFAPPAGHVDNKGSFENAAKEETREEVGLIPTEIKLLAEGRKENPCRRPGGFWHYWKIYQVAVDEEDDIKRSEDETKQAGWFTPDQIRELAQKSKRYLAREISDEEWQKSPGIEPVWMEWFEELGILN